MRLKASATLAAPRVRQSKVKSLCSGTRVRLLGGIESREMCLLNDLLIYGRTRDCLVYSTLRWRTVSSQDLMLSIITTSGGRSRQFAQETRMATTTHLLTQPGHRFW